MTNYETTIGIEVHCELNTKHKIFSPSLNDINAEPNTNVHPIDLALPGTLPRFNEEVMKKAIIIADALNMDITTNMHWDRKNYFYPDNPKGYQITQQETPIGRKGYITLDSGKKILVDFMHMEEDTAKSFHDGDETKLDFNRCGVPLVEIVSGADMSSADEAREYVEKLRQILLYQEVSDCKMNEGSFRVDVNVSIRPIGQEKLNQKVEIKNLNSFSNVYDAINLEVKNQLMMYHSGEEVLACTKRFNESTKTVDIMRVKESMDDYRFFPEPDLPNIIIDQKYIDSVLVDSKILPSQIKSKMLDLGFSINEINSIMGNKDMTLFFLECLENNLDPKQSFNYLNMNVVEVLKKEKIEFLDSKLSIKNLVDIASFLESGKISSAHVKKIIPHLVLETMEVEDIVEKLGLVQITDPKVIGEFVQQVLDSSPESVQLYKSGKNKAFGFMIGQIMKVSKGQANPQLVNKILQEKLDQL